MDRFSRQPPSIAAAPPLAPFTTYAPIPCAAHLSPRSKRACSEWRQPDANARRHGATSTTPRPCCPPSSGRTIPQATCSRGREPAEEDLEIALRRAPPGRRRHRAEHPDDHEQVRGVEVVADRAGAVPGGHDGAEDRAGASAQAVAHAGGEVVLGERLEEPAVAALQPGGSREEARDGAVRIAGDERLRRGRVEFVEDRLEDGEDEVRLGGEVAVERGDAHPGAARELVDADVEALVAERRGGHVGQPRPVAAGVAPWRALGRRGAHQRRSYAKRRGPFGSLVELPITVGTLRFSF